jgi:hypothetical protein
MLIAITDFLLTFMLGIAVAFVLFAIAFNFNPPFIYFLLGVFFIGIFVLSFFRCSKWPRSWKRFVAVLVLPTTLLTLGLIYEIYKEGRGISVEWFYLLAGVILSALIGSLCAVRRRPRTQKN